MEAEPTVTACVLIIGNEILSGRTQDANLSYLAKGLNEAGVRLREARVIPDVADTIVATVNEVRGRYDYVITTGGIGPTHDDITSECVARAFGVPLILHEGAKRILEARYRERGLELNEARLRMAHVPKGATLVLNSVSGAPGFRMGNVFVLAGVPQIMQAMFEGVKGELRGGRPVLSRAISCGLAEGQLAKGLGEIQTRYPDIDIGSYPWYRRGAYGVSLVLRSPDERRLGLASDEVAGLVRGLGGTPSDE
ncbi:MAG TPA: competence/damage-inducible protein A [Stellaceae bacterium]|nr:competence/damage-inducible protein A [Stellaceae bacterium]